MHLARKAFLKFHEPTLKTQLFSMLPGWNKHQAWRGWKKILQSLNLPGAANFCAGALFVTSMADAPERFCFAVQNLGWLVPRHQL